MHASSGRLAASLLTLCIGCFSQDSVGPGAVDESNERSQSNGSWTKYPPPTTLASASTDTTFKARWDGWISQKMNEGPCVDSLFAAPDTLCQFIQIGRWGGEDCCEAQGRTFGAWDFNTSNLPNDAVIQDVSFTIHVANVYTKTQTTPPGAIVPCLIVHPTTDWIVSSTGEDLQVGYSWGQYNK